MKSQNAKGTKRTKTKQKQKPKRNKNKKNRGKSLWNCQYNTNIKNFHGVKLF